MNSARRNLVKWVAGSAGLLASCRRGPENAPAAPGRAADVSGEEYVWLSANAQSPLFVAHDHPALFQAAKELGVKVTIAGPNTVDIPGLVAAVEQTAARKPAGMMVVGWDPSALVPLIDRAMAGGVPVVCVDADVPASKRIAFVGTDWYDLGVEQGRAMLRGLTGRKGRIAMLGLIEQYIDQRAFAGFRSVLAPAGFELLEPLQDRANQAESARVASAVIQATPDLAGIAGFDSESGPGIALAIRETGRTGKIVATTVDAEEQHMEALRAGALYALVMQKRELFTYYGVKALYECHHSPVHLTRDDRRAGVWPVPAALYTGTCTITRENLDLFSKA